MRHTLYYLHDPMCSWCYAFAPVWQQLKAALPADVTVVRLLGGLAPDSDDPMAESMQEHLQQTWRRIEQSVPGTSFNHDFWHRGLPRRSTYPACRAVIAARAQGAQYDEAMTAAIQRAYYREARNPSDSDTLIALAAELGLDVAAFSVALSSAETEAILQHEIAQTRQLGVDSFPSLVLAVGKSHWPVAIDYRDSEPMRDTIAFLLEEAQE